jgi:hypothetical protein
LALASTSRAADGGYLALADLAEIAATLDVDYRIVGGHMVTLLAGVYGVSEQVILRETLDADFGAPPEVVADPRLPRALRERRYSTPGAANRFVCQENAHRHPDRVIDILAPSFEGRLLSGRQHGGLVVDEIPGLAFALNRPPIEVELGVRLSYGSDIGMRLVLPDLVGALCIKALAYRGRFADKDAVDLWRLMNAAYAAGLRADSWPGTVTGRRAAEVFERFFSRRRAAGLKQVSNRRDDQLRMQAMTFAVVGRATAMREA